MSRKSPSVFDISMSTNPLFVRLAITNCVPASSRSQLRLVLILSIITGPCSFKKLENRLEI